MIGFARFGRTGRYLLTGAAVAAAVMGGTLPAAAATTAGPTVQPAGTVATGRSAGGITFEVIHNGLFVVSATVINNSAPTAFGRIINTGNGAVHTSSAKLGHGGHFTVGFERSVLTGDEICGEVGASTRICVDF